MSRILIGLGLAATLLLPVTPAAAAPQTLPANVVPVHYDLALAPDAQALTYKGVVTITIAVASPTADIVLNSDGLVFDRAAIDGKLLGKPSSDEKLGRATLHFATAISPGTHSLAIAYHSQLRRETLGFFAMDYRSDAGPRRTLGTNFEPAYARRLLPCWDEPARKATFTVSVDIPKDRMAVSNMPVATVTDLPGNVQRVRFATTPKMSTYLLFLGVGDFERVHKTVDGVDVGVVVKRGDLPKAAYALDQATKLLHFYDGWFGVRFPLPKLDLIAAPGDIDGDSMENWGAIFYSQSSLLFDPATSTERDRQGVFEVVSHEMSHQWFGDLVTMAWWDNLWLNEGFARWMQTYAADALHPEWKTGLQAQTIFERGKTADALPSTHPIVQDVMSVEQAHQAFDDITYDKGAAVITMLNAYMGPDNFREGVRRYMRAHAYGNTVDTDLWSIMQTVAGKPILKIEHDFTRVDGLPLVRVTATPNGLHLAEDRFVADPSLAGAMPAHRLTLPLAVAPVPGKGQAILLAGDADVSVRAPAIVNAGQSSYLRVWYPQGAFDALLPVVRQLDPADEIGLMNDSYQLGLSGYAPLSNLLAVMARLAPDSDPVVWRRVVQVLNELDRRFAERPDRTAFHAYARGLLAPALQSIGVEARPREEANVTLLRGALKLDLGLFGDRNVLDWARKTLTSGTGTAEDQRTALTVAAAAADEATFDNLLDRARKTKDPLAKERLYEALGGVDDAKLASRMIKIALAAEPPAGDNIEVLINVAAKHPDLLWREGIPHISDPQAAITKVYQWIAAAEIAKLSADPTRIKDVEEYVAKNVPVEARKPFSAVPVAVRRNQRIAATVLPELDKWMAVHGAKQQ